MITGIYKITNKTNNKVYIGSAIDIKKRWRDHKWHLKENKYHNSYLQSSYNKHGLNKFEFIIEVECSINDLLNEETKIIKHYDAYNNKCGYNVNDPEHVFLGRKHTKETKLKLSIQKKGNKNPMYGKIGEKHHNFGIKLSAEVRKRISDGHIGQTGKKGEDSPISKLNEDNVINIRKHYQNNEYNQRELSEMFNVSQSAINMIINRKRWSHV